MPLEIDAAPLASPSIAPASAVPASAVPPSSEGTQDLWAYDQIHHAVGRIFRPDDERELGALLRKLSADPTTHRITFRGGGQAMDAHALNDDIVIEIDSPAFRRIGEPRRDDAGYHVTVGAAAPWGAIMAKAAEWGHLPYSVVTTTHATAGGTAAAACLSRCSPISGKEGHHIRSFRLMTVDGRQVTCRRDDPDPDRAALFHAVIGGFGYLGVITELTIDLRPPLPGWAPGRRIRVSTRADKHLIGSVGSARWAEVLPRLRERASTRAVAEGEDGLLGKLFHLRHEHDDAEEVAWDAVWGAAWHALGGVEALTCRSRYVIDREVHPFPIHQRPGSLVDPLSRVMHLPALTELAEGALFLFYPAGVYVDELSDFTFFMENQIGPARDAAQKAGFRLNAIQQTFVLPAAPTEDDPSGTARVARFLDVVRPTLFDDPDEPSFVDPMRPTLMDLLFLPADEFLLSANRGMEGWAVTISYTERDEEGWDRLRARLRELSRRCLELGGRVHMVKNVETDPPELLQMYGEAFDRFLALKRRYDPRGLIGNGFFDRIFRPADHRRRQ